MSYIALRHRKTAPAFTSGSSVKVMETPACHREPVRAVSKGIAAKMAAKTKVKRVVTRR